MRIKIFASERCDLLALDVRKPSSLPFQFFLDRVACALQRQDE
jgi:hypothetical protein